MGGTEVVSLARAVKPASINAPVGGIIFYASDDVTVIAILDESGNLLLKGGVGSL